MARKMALVREAGLKSNLADCQLALAKQALRSLNAPPDQVLMSGNAKSLAK